jgi:hypothetical protein
MMAIFSTLVGAPHLLRTYYHTEQLQMTRPRTRRLLRLEHLLRAIDNPFHFGMALLDHLFHLLPRLLQVVWQDALVELVLSQLLVMVLARLRDPFVRHLRGLRCLLDSRAAGFARRGWERDLYGQGA